MPLKNHTLVIGAGPAGLAAAHALSKTGAMPLVLERSDQVGGLSRTETYKGFFFDVGGHRFYTRSNEVWRLWQELLGEELLKVRRLSRIHYNGRFFSYPLRPLDTLRQLGLYESARVIASYAAMRVRPRPQPENFEQWTINRFGRRLYEVFFKSYTEKVWGIPCTSIDADWADLRIGNLSLTKALRNALFRPTGIKTLISEFHYPRLGPGMVWERLRGEIEATGGQVRLGCEVVGLEREGWRIRSLVFRTPGSIESIGCEQVITSMPLADLILRLNPPPPTDVLQAARQLRYRAFIMVGLIVDRPDIFPDNWIYVHSPHVRVGRVQNFRNWSAALVPDPAKSSVGMEYFCTEGDELWNRTDAELIALARRELAALGLAGEEHVVDGTVVRETAAYPLYFHGYQRDVQTIRRFVDRLENLQTIGRNGMHRYNNQDHSMLSGLLAARNILGEAHDLWSVDPDALEQPSPGGSVPAADSREDLLAGRTVTESLVSDQVDHADVDRELEIPSGSPRS
ncbi:MAG: NAD(P)/FAD-dependent oxidoreductase [Candidatus Eisenbacteria bacterium]